MKRSRSVPLVLIGTLTLITGCNEPVEPVQADLQQEFYTSQEDCVRDWGNDPRNCTASDGYTTANAQGNAGTGGGNSMLLASSRSPGYYGPRYYWDRKIGTPVVVDADGSTRPTKPAFAAQGKSSLAKAVSSKRASVSPTHITRGGFGGGARFSSGG